ncbi:MAG TPA: acyl-CoA dehydrogenase family protein [Reyranella sp.]|jgi:alkylation response protein AidB-like acyl-CoA dehydrogenase
MRFSFSAEQEEFRGTLRRALEARSPTKEVRRLMATDEGFDREGWKRLNQELGLTGLHIPEAYGGQGFGFGELGIVLEEMGRSLLCAPYLSTVLAATAILNAGTEDQKKSLLPGLADGSVTATLAFQEGNGGMEAASVAMTASGSRGKYKLDGTKSFVLDGHTADLIVVVARRKGTKGPNGLSFFTVAGDAAGLTRRKLKTMDETRKLAHLIFAGVEAKLLGAAGEGGAAFEKTMLQALVCLANEMVGGADRLREDALEYVKMRMQFGRSIASFQTTKNKAADMLAEVELAKSAAYYAAAALDDGDGDVPALASLAKAQASEAYLQTAIHAVQMHGGIGFTWDNDTHLWFKRAKSSEILFGDANEHREKMIQAWGQQAAE